MTMMLNPADAATAYLLRLPKHIARPEALVRCAEFLATQHNMNTERAQLQALQALAELEAINQTAYIDADVTTLHVAVVRRPGKEPLAFTVNDLLRLHARERTCAAPSDTAQH